jgi:hypothetical protein
MAITEIPRAFLYTCDGCGKQDKQENASGHYTDSRPPHWTRIKVARTAYDFQGSACADASIERLLCPDCSERVIAAINNSLVREPRTAAGSLD